MPVGAAMMFCGSLLSTTQLLASTTWAELCLIWAGHHLDSSNNIYIVGYAASTNFPTTTGAYQVSNGEGLGCDYCRVK